MGGIGFSYAYDFARNEGNVSLSPVFEALQSFFIQDFSLTFQFSRIFNLFYPGFFSLFSFQGFSNLFSPGFLFSHLEAIVTGVEVEKQSLTLVTWGKTFFVIAFPLFNFFLFSRRVDNRC